MPRITKDTKTATTPKRRTVAVKRANPRRTAVPFQAKRPSVSDRVESDYRLWVSNRRYTQSQMNSAVAISVLSTAVLAMAIALVQG